MRKKLNLFLLTNLVLRTLAMHGIKITIKLDNITDQIESKIWSQGQKKARLKSKT